MHALHISPGKAFRRLAAVGVTITAAAALLMPLSSATAEEPSAQSDCIPNTSTIAECFPDHALAGVVAAVAKDVLRQPTTTTASTFTSDMVNNITAIGRNGSGVPYGNEKGIVSLEGISHLTRLTELDLTDNLITDLSPIAEMTQLEHIEFQSYAPGHNLITSISALKNLNNLTWVSLEPFSSATRTTNTIMDLSPLKGHTNLDHLYLSNNSITDISPLHGIIDKSTPIYLWLKGNRTILPESASSTSTSIETAKGLNGAHIAPYSIFPNTGSYDSSTGRVTWTGLTPGSQVSLEYQSAGIACACSIDKYFSGKIEQTLPMVDAPIPPVTNPPIVAPPSTPPSENPPSTNPPATENPPSTLPSPSSPVATPHTPLDTSPTTPTAALPDCNPPSANPPAANSPSANSSTSTTNTSTSTLPDCNPPTTQPAKTTGTSAATPNAPVPATAPNAPAAAAAATSESPKQAAEEQAQARAAESTQLATTGSSITVIVAVLAMTLAAGLALSIISKRRASTRR